MANKTKAELLKEIEELKNEVKKLERYQIYEDGANETAAVRDAFVAAGFTKAEAFELTKGILNTAFGRKLY